MQLFLMPALSSVRAANVEYLTLNVSGSPVEIILAEHPVITYTDNTLHIQTAKETIDVPINQISGVAFSETSGIKSIENQQFQIQEGSIYFQRLPKGSKVCIFTTNGIEVMSSIVNDYGQTIINISDLPKGIFVVKSATQSFKITNK